jgi:hypothetical protein
VLRQDPHPPTTVAAVRFLIERSALPFRDIEAGTGVNNGTISRWVKKFGWRRHEAARPLKLDPAPERVPLGRTLATRLRAQAERLLAEVEAAPEVDAARLREALQLLADARAEQSIRRGRRTPKPPPAEPKARRRKPSDHNRLEAALKGWSRRYARANPALEAPGRTSPRVAAHAAMLKRDG